MLGLLHQFLIDLFAHSRNRRGEKRVGNICNYTFITLKHGRVQHQKKINSALLIFGLPLL